LEERVAETVVGIVDIRVDLECIFVCLA
jgi:hypothetical protein